MTWREIARPIIIETIQKWGKEDKKLLTQKLREIYPFGERKYHPYKVWCDEIRVQLGIKLNRVIMSEKIGRPLECGESVHHKNGIRDYNRIENLELWSTSQPYGQRISDKIKWAKEIIKKYGKDLSLYE